MYVMNITLQKRVWKTVTETLFFKKIEVGRLSGKVHN
jgi:hypothetical protein